MIDKISIEARSAFQFELIRTIINHYGWTITKSICERAATHFADKEKNDKPFIIGNFAYGDNPKLVECVIEYYGYFVKPTKEEKRFRSIDQLEKFLSQRYVKTFTFTKTVSVRAQTEAEAREKLRKDESELGWTLIQDK